MCTCVPVLTNLTKNNELQIFIQSCNDPLVYETSKICTVVVPGKVFSIDENRDIVKTNLLCFKNVVSTNQLSR